MKFDRTLQIRINPDTYLRFDGSDHISISNIACEHALRMKPDILLVLWDMVQWKSVAELLAPWPETDQMKILEYLEKLHHYKIIATAADNPANFPAVLPESGISGKVGAKIHFNLENHHVMLRDFVRVSSYRRAIENALRHGGVAMDLGCGTGILSFIAARAGAGKVYALEKRGDILNIARILAAENQIQNIEFIEGLSSAIPSETVQPKPDVLIAEILGNGILEENILEFTIDARNRFLKPQGRMIPQRLEIYAFPFEVPRLPEKQQEVDEFRSLYGFDFSVFGALLASQASLRFDYYQDSAFRTLSPPQCVKQLDFATLESETFKHPFEFTMTQPGNFSGYCAYFKAWLDDETVITNSPWAARTHWSQMIFTLAKPVSVQIGDQIPMEILYDGQLRFNLLY